MKVCPVGLVCKQNFTRLKIPKIRELQTIMALHEVSNNSFMVIKKYDPKDIQNKFSDFMDKLDEKSGDKDLLFWIKKKNVTSPKTYLTYSGIEINIARNDGENHISKEISCQDITESLDLTLNSLIDSVDKVLGVSDKEREQEQFLEKKQQERAIKEINSGYNEMIGKYLQH